MSSRPALVPLVSSPPSAAALRWPHGCLLYLRPTCASWSSRAVARGATARDPPQPRLVAAQSPPPLAAGAVRRGAETGRAILLVVLAAAIKTLEIKANKLAEIVAEEIPGTLSSLKLSFLEINDLTSQLQKLRKMLTISQFGKKTSTKTTFRTGQT
ncbi:hypothetical protein QOZ80_5AG0405790 [Eleusine coracana subsp. coracana]|nr:hypothetical protein QOZ80_5AG0405790 [Eleusine coracana subsp. coracana]